MISVKKALVGLVVLTLCFTYLTVAQEMEEHEATEISAELRALIHETRGATAQFHNLDVAIEAGYGELLSCFQHGPERGMGQHYANGNLLDDVLDPLQPEALVYEPREDGTMILVAFEYIVPAEAWDPDDEGRAPPTLFGQELTLRTNIPETPPIWALHLWLWSHNPEGLFADYNPLIICPQDQPITEMGM